MLNIKRPSCSLVVFPCRGLFHSMSLFMKPGPKNTEEKDIEKKS